MSDELPTQIGPYEIQGRLGAGGMGTVFLGKHVGSEQLAAVKVLDGSLAREAALVERFLREIETMRSLGGPHIVKLFDHGTDATNGLLYYAMEYVDGGTLTDYIREQPNRRLPWDQVIDLALQICAALKVAHAAGIIHRDLKPSNLLLGLDGVLKLTDFGVAQVFAANRLTVTGGIIGTVEYMSPEQAEGKRATKVSDLYSLGAVMYAMLTGRPPFTGKTLVDVIRKHATARFDMPSLYDSSIPRLLEEVVCKLLAKNPDERYPDAYIVSLRLKEVLKRVELAEASDEEGITTGGLRSDSEAPTMMASRSEEAMPETRAAPGRALSPATFMRDMFKAQVEQDQKRSRLEEFLNQTGVLVLMLIVLIGVAIWGLNGRKSAVPDAAADSEAVTEGAAIDEVDRFLKLARSYRRAGDFAREESLLSALRVMIGDDANQASQVKTIDRRLDELRTKRSEQSDEFQLAKAAIGRAQTLLNDHKTAEANAILESVIQLYEHESAAAAVVEDARRLRSQAEK